jgi:Flp pilus assembly protein TadD
MTLFALEQPAMAEEVLRRVIDRDPEHAPALNALGYTLADENRNLDEADRLIGQALQIDPDNTAYLDSLGWLRYRQGRIDEAVTALETAYRQSPNAEIGAHLGEVLWARGERDRAIAVWEESLELDRDDDTLNETIRRFAPELRPATNSSRPGRCTRTGSRRSTTGLSTPGPRSAPGSLVAADAWNGPRWVRSPH